METPIDRNGATDIQPLPPAPTVTQALESQPFPIPPAAAPQPEPQPEPVVSPSLFVSFVGVNKKGKQRFGRMTVQGMFPPRQVAMVHAIENAIGKERDLTQVELISWAQLEG